MAGKSFRELIVWERAMQLAVYAYRLTLLLPREEKFAIGDQMRRSAVSIPSNIAEGNARGPKEMVHFLQYAQGSRVELETQVEICYRVGYITEAHLRQHIELSTEVGRMISSMIKTLSKHY